MNFAEAEVKYRELRKQKDLGKPFSRSEFEDQVGQLTVQDENGTCWEIHPYVGRWMYYDRTQWVYGIPPGRPGSDVLSPTFIETPGTPMTKSMPGRVTEPEHLTTWSKRKAANRTRRQILSWSKRPWIPFVVVSALLFVCACLTFFGGQFVLGGMAQTTEPTQTLVARVQIATPMPTITLQPTLPVPTETSVPVIGRIIEARVNVRTAPSLDAAIIGKVTREEQITLIGRSEDGAWYRVQITGIDGPSWIFGETLEIARGNPAELPVSQ